jgi:hypothetical protein
MDVSMAEKFGSCEMQQENSLNIIAASTKQKKKISSAPSAEPVRLVRPRLLDQPI